MYRFLIAASLMFAGCTASKPLFPKHSFGTKVEIKGGFYKGSSGHITDWSACYDRDTKHATVCYEITYVDIFVQKMKPVNEKDVIPVQ